MDEVLSDFIAETREGLEALDSELVRFERDPRDPAPLASVFRLMHTIKGACGFIGLVRLQRVAHAAEEVLGGFRDGSLTVNAAAVTTILEAVEAPGACTLASSCMDATCGGGHRAALTGLAPQAH